MMIPKESLPIALAPDPFPLLSFHSRVRVPRHRRHDCSAHPQCMRPGTTSAHESCRPSPFAPRPSPLAARRSWAPHTLTTYADSLACVVLAQHFLARRSLPSLPLFPISSVLISLLPLPTPISHSPFSPLISLLSPASLPSYTSDALPILHLLPIPSPSCIPSCYSPRRLHPLRAQHGRRDTAPVPYTSAAVDADAPTSCSRNRCPSPRVPVPGPRSIRILLPRPPRASPCALALGHVPYDPRNCPRIVCVHAPHAHGVPGATITPCRARHARPASRGTAALDGSRLRAAADFICVSTFQSAL
ncbi:hypothetical protein DFH06DRAFT_1423423 [Mycena polygramma]|nr:hypothetical protein DFH06DRAFT_1423423 [Mycena polygramma]